MCNTCKTEFHWDLYVCSWPESHTASIVATCTDFRETCHRAYCNDPKRHTGNISVQTTFRKPQGPRVYDVTLSTGCCLLLSLKSRDLTIIMQATIMF